MSAITISQSFRRYIAFMMKFLCYFFYLSSSALHYRFYEGCVVIRVIQYDLSLLYFFFFSFVHNDCGGTFVSFLDIYFGFVVELCYSLFFA